MNTTHDPAATATPSTPTPQAVHLGVDMNETGQVGLTENDQHLLVYASEGTRSVIIRKLVVGAGARNARVGVIDLSGFRGNDYRQVRDHVRLAYDITEALNLMATTYSLAQAQPGTENWLFIDGLHTTVLPGNTLPADLDPDLADMVYAAHNRAISVFWEFLVRLMALDNVRVVFVMRSPDFTATSKVLGTRDFLDIHCARVVVDADPQDHRLAFLHDRSHIDLLNGYRHSIGEKDFGWPSLLIEHYGKTAELGALAPLGPMSAYTGATAQMKGRWA